MNYIKDQNNEILARSRRRKLISDKAKSAGVREIEGCLTEGEVFVTVRFCDGLFATTQFLFLNNALSWVKCHNWGPFEEKVKASYFLLKRDCPPPSHNVVKEGPCIEVNA